MLKRVQAFFDDHLSVRENSIVDVPHDPIRLATAAILVEMSRADFDESAIEQDRIRELVQVRFGLNPESAAELYEIAAEEADNSVSLYELTRLVNQEFSADEKRRIVELMWEVAYADGRLDKHEEHLVRKVAELIYLPHKDFIQTKNQVMSKLKP